MENPLTMIFRALYDTADGVTQMVGLSPLQFGGVIGALLFLGVMVQLVLVLMGKRGWTLEDGPGDSGTAKLRGWSDAATVFVAEDPPEKPPTIGNWPRG